MKRIIAVLLTILLLCMSVGFAGCSKSGTASQDEFLIAMATGISNRLKNVDDGKERTEEELYQYYANLVQLELKEISKYKNVSFKDSLFDELAHEYIAGCEMQLTGARNHESASALWPNGSSVRNSIINIMYTQYGLPISEQEASNYGIGGTFTIALDDASAQGTKDFDADAVEKQLEISNFVGTGKSGKYTYHYGATIIKNNSEEAVKVEFTLKYYKGSSLVDAENGIIWCVLPGETGGCQEIYSGEKLFDRTEVEISSISRVSNSVTDKYRKQADMLSYSTSISGNNVLVEIKNKTDIKLSLTYTVVFYKNGVPVWAEPDFYHDVDAGHSIVEAFEPINKDMAFDHVEVFFNDFI